MQIKESECSNDELNLTSISCKSRRHMNIVFNMKSLLRWKLYTPVGTQNKVNKGDRKS